MRRRSWFLSLVLCACLSLLLARPALVRETSWPLRILHTNDHHAHLEPITTNKTTLGGIAQRKQLVDRLRQDSKQQRENVLLLDAGDIFQGTLFFNRYAGLADAHFYNGLNYDAAVVGNHEFDRGQLTLAKFIDHAEFPVLSANMQLDRSSPLVGKVKPWIIRKLQGQKVGILGLTTKDTVLLSNPGDGVSFRDPIVAAKQAVRELQAQGINKIIAVTHLGINVDRQLAQQVDGIDVIVGGHSHSLIGAFPGAIDSYPLVEKSPNGHPVLVVTDWEWGKHLGDLQVKFDRQGKLIKWTGQPHSLDSSVKPDPVFQSQLQQFAAPLESLRRKVIGSTVSLLDGDRVKIRSRETNLGNLVADAMLAKTRAIGAQVVLINGGGLRSSIPAGQITVSQVLEAMPFSSTITYADLTGKQLQAALENGVSKVADGDGRFPQVAGLRFVWQPTTAPGQRIVSVQVQEQSEIWQPLVADKIYRVVTNNFMLGGGDGYEVLKNAQSKGDSGFVLSDVVMEYITAQSPLNVKVSDRITQKIE
jgi:5'-nucleotidase / UDP-sugar diphosphatase